jgi:hypothetical protein
VVLKDIASDGIQNVFGRLDNGHSLSSKEKNGKEPWNQTADYQQGLKRIYDRKVHTAPSL